MPKKRKYFAGAPQKKGKQLQSTEAASETDLIFIRLVRERKYKEALAIIDQVEDINVVDQQTQATALHFAAYRSCVALIDALEKRSDLNYLAQDKKGRYPSQLAWEEAGHEELGAKLIHKEAEQARREGIKAWPKKPPFTPRPG